MSGQIDGDRHEIVMGPEAYSSPQAIEVAPPCLHILMLFFGWLSPGLLAGINNFVSAYPWLLEFKKSILFYLNLSIP